MSAARDEQLWRIEQVLRTDWQRDRRELIEACGKMGVDVPRLPPEPDFVTHAAYLLDAEIQRMAGEKVLERLAHERGEFGPESGVGDGSVGGIDRSANSWWRNGANLPHRLDDREWADVTAALQERVDASVRRQGWNLSMALGEGFTGSTFDGFSGQVAHYADGRGVHFVDTAAATEGMRDRRIHDDAEAHGVGWRKPWTKPHG